MGGQVDAVIGQLTERWSESLLRALCAAGGAIYSQYAVGFDNVDVEAATGLGLPVGNTPGVLTETTAELAVALTMAAARRIVEGDRLMRSGAYHGWLPDLLLGSLLYRRTVGVIGAGRIGTAYARMMVEGHKMDLVYYDGTATTSWNATLRTTPAFSPPAAKSPCSAGGPPQRANLRLRRCGQHPRHAHGRDPPPGWSDELGQMKDDAVLVNASRGPLLDEAALVRHCRSHPAFRAAGRRLRA